MPQLHLLGTTEPTLTIELHVNFPGIKIWCGFSVLDVNEPFILKKSHRSKYGYIFETHYIYIFFSSFNAWKHVWYSALISHQPGVITQFRKLKAVLPLLALSSSLQRIFHRWFPLTQCRTQASCNFGGKDGYHLTRCGIIYIYIYIYKPFTLGL